MSPLEAVGYGILLVVLTVTVTTMLWDTWRHHQLPPTPPFPRPPTDTHGVTTDARWRPTPVDQPPAQPATPTTPGAWCGCPKCTP